jgi:hypothetical protein
MVHAVEAVRSPAAIPDEPSPVPSKNRPPVLGWVCAVAALGAAAALAVAALSGDSDAKPIGQPLIAEHGSVRSIEGSVEDAHDRPVPPQSHAVIAERGSIRAIEGSVDDTAGRGSGPVDDADGAAFPNPWAAGNEAVERQLAEQAEREAHLDGQARTYGGTDGP